MITFNFVTFFSPLPVLLMLAPSVVAHGFVRSVTINGVNFPGPVPNNDAGLKSPVRAINNVEPVKGANNPDINCGHDAQASALAPEAPPGSVVTFDWTSGEGGTTNWPHNTGPILNYMTPCGEQGCASFDPANAKWFKISEQGRTSSGDWVQQDLFDGKTVDVTLPTTLPAGQYLIRHEIIGMHLGTDPGGAEFYPACIAITLSAPNSSITPQLPDESIMVAFPGGYNDNDPGILDPNIYDTDVPYIFPGPAVFTGAPSASISGASPSASVPSPRPTASASTSSAVVPASAVNDTAPTPSVGVCGAGKKKKRMVKRHGRHQKEHGKVSTTFYKVVHKVHGVIYKPVEVGKHRPGEMSRIMRDIH